MRKAFFVGAAALTLFCAAPAFAGFATTVSYQGPTGSGQGAALVSPPTSAVGDVSTAYQVWNESSGVIAAPVTLENNGAVGSYTGVSPGTSTTLGTGTPYGSTFIQLNPGVNGVVHSGEAIIQFSSKIIGIALSGATSPTSLGSLGATDQPTAHRARPIRPPITPNNNRGIIGQTNDSFQITNGGTELIVQLTANFNGFKELRVFTAAAPPAACLSRLRWPSGRWSARSWSAETGGGVSGRLCNRDDSRFPASRNRKSDIKLPCRSVHKAAFFFSCRPLRPLLSIGPKDHGHIAVFGISTRSGRRSLPLPRNAFRGFG